MRRLTKLQDKVLQKLIREGMPTCEIAKRAGVSDGTVLGVRKACAAVDAMSTSTKEKIRRLLWAKIPTPQIAAMLDTSVENVRSLRRLDRFCDPPEGVSVCSECGTQLFAPMRDQSCFAENLEGLVCKFSQENFTGLLRIVRDLLELSDLRLIPHPLFYHLSQRARKAFEKTYEKETKKIGRAASS